MEPVGLAVGILGLGGLFSTCLEAVEKFDSYKNFDRDSRSLATVFDADKYRFEQWGRAVGIKEGKLSDPHHPALDDAKNLAVVHKLLASIRDFCSGEDDASYHRPTPADSTFLKDGPLSTRQAQPRHGLPADSKLRRAAWAFSGKTKRTGHVQTFAVLVQYLYSVVPPDDTNGTPSGHGARNYGPAHLHDTYLNDGPWFTEIRDLMRKAEEETRAETKRDLRAWLGSPSPNDVYDDSIQKRLDGTCEWILARAEFRNWLSPGAPPGASKLLWINGPAGYGKTILCAKLVEVISSAPQTPTAHFFLSSKSEGRHDPFLAIRSWLAAMTSQSQAALDVVRKRRLAQHEQLATRATIIQLFREVVQTVPFCTFVLDGLDECTWVGESFIGSDSVARFLEDLRQAIDNTSARILVVSRNESEIRQGLMRYSGFSEYKISLEDVCADNIAYSRSIVDNKLSNKDEPTRLSISQRMADRCHGQFQWLKMQEDFLKKWRNRKQLEKDIDETPAGLDSLYDRNWDRIERLRDVERRRAFSLLRWAAFALRPLTVCEIAEAVLINDDWDDLPVDELPDSVDDYYIDSEILGLCGSLIEVRGTSPGSSAGSRKIHLAHFSVKQYLLCKIPSRQATLLANESLRASNEVIEGITLAKLCLRYITFQRVWDGSLPEERDRIGTSFREYAAEYWYQHTDVSNTKDEALLEAMNALFDGRAQTWESWRQWFDVNSEDLQPDASETVMPASSLYYASRLGLTGVARYLIQQCKHDPNEGSKSGRVALEVACEKGNREIVQMLLEVGADIDIQGHRGRTPLYGASMNGHLELVKLVLQNEGNLTIQNVAGLTPLNVASGSGHLEVVKLLLDKGADITVATKDGWTPLNAASDSGHLEVVKLLLDKGADITVTNKNGWTPLNAALSKGHLEVVKLLLDKGADITVANKYGWTPLNSASNNGHVEVVKLLLDKGADITVANKDGRTPLNAASGNGHLKVVKLLLDKGADITVANDYGWTPLNSASNNGHVEVVKLLLDKEVDITVATKYGWTPLHAASFKGHAEVVKLLLDKGADITVTDKGGWTPLNAASSNGHLEVIKLLLDKGADITVASQGGWTPLNAASSNGHLEVIKLLLDKGADITVATKDGRTPLNAASNKGHLEVVKLLLDKGADIYGMDNDGRTALFHAAMRGHHQIVRFLLSKKAPVNSKDRYNATSLIAASRNGHGDPVELLLEAENVCIDCRDELGRTALCWARKSRNDPTVQLLLRHFEGALPQGGDAVALTDNYSTPFDVDLSWCDVCTICIPDGKAYHQCESCNGGDFMICLECSGVGVRCQDNAHKWVLHESD